MVKETDFILKGYSSRCFFWKLGESPKISFVNDQDYVGQVGKSQNSVRTLMDFNKKESYHQDEVIIKWTHIGL